MRVAVREYEGVEEGLGDPVAVAEQESGSVRLHETLAVWEVEALRLAVWLCVGVVVGRRVGESVGVGVTVGDADAGLRVAVEVRDAEGEGVEDGVGERVRRMLAVAVGPEGLRVRECGREAVCEAEGVAVWVAEGEPVRERGVAESVREALRVPLRDAVGDGVGEAERDSEGRKEREAERERDPVVEPVRVGTRVAVRLPVAEREGVELQEEDAVAVGAPVAVRVRVNVQDRVPGAERLRDGVPEEDQVDVGAADGVGVREAVWVVRVPLAVAVGLELRETERDGENVVVGTLEGVRVRDGLCVWGPVPEVDGLAVGERVCVCVEEAVQVGLAHALAELVGLVVPEMVREAEPQGLREPVPEADCVRVKEDAVARLGVHVCVGARDCDALGLGLGLQEAVRVARALSLRVRVAVREGVGVEDGGEGVAEVGVGLRDGLCETVEDGEGEAVRVRERLRPAVMEGEGDALREALRVSVADRKPLAEALRDEEAVALRVSVADWDPLPEREGDAERVRGTEAVGVGVGVPDVEHVALPERAPEREVVAERAERLALREAVTLPDALNVAVGTALKEWVAEEEAEGERDSVSVVGLRERERERDRVRPVVALGVQEAVAVGRPLQVRVGLSVGGVRVL